MNAPEQQAKLAAALQMITESIDPVIVRSRMAYAFGYIDALNDAGHLGQAEADALQAHAQHLRDKHLLALGGQ